MIPGNRLIQYWLTLTSYTRTEEPLIKSMATLRESGARHRKASCAGNGHSPWQVRQRGGGVRQSPPEGASSHSGHRLNQRLLA